MTEATMKTHKLHDLSHFGLRVVVGILFHGSQYREIQSPVPRISDKYRSSRRDGHTRRAFGIHR
jgi:hypothetical protein